MEVPRQLVHTEWFDHALQSLGTLPHIEEILARDLYRIALYADLVPCLGEESPLRVFQTKEFLREDGQLIRLLIYFVLRPDNAVVLQHIEAVHEDMEGTT